MPPDPLGALTLFDGSKIGQRTTPTSRTSTTRPSTESSQAAAKLSGASRNRAASRLALELERDDAPAAAIGTNASRDFFSARIGCQVYQPVSASTSPPSAYGGKCLGRK